MIPPVITLLSSDESSSDSDSSNSDCYEDKQSSGKEETLKQHEETEKDNSIDIILQINADEAETLHDEEQEMDSTKGISYEAEKRRR